MTRRAIDRTLTVVIWLSISMFLIRRDLGRARAAWHRSSFRAGYRLGQREREAHREPG